MTQVNGHKSQKAFFSKDRWVGNNLALWSNDEVNMCGSMNKYRMGTRRQCTEGGSLDGVNRGLESKYLIWPWPECRHTRLCEISLLEFNKALSIHSKRCVGKSVWQCKYMQILMCWSNYKKKWLFISHSSLMETNKTDQESNMKV